MNAITDLTIIVKGEIAESNFDAYKEQIMDRIAAINTDLKNDEDFEQAKGIVKQLDEAEKAMAVAKADALKQAEDVYKLFDAIDDVTAISSKKRIELKNIIAKRNEDLKTEKVNAADREIYDYMETLGDEFKSQRYGDAIYSLKGLRDCLYRKSSFAKMDEALAQYVEESKQRCDDRVGILDANHAKLDAVADEHKTLFQDRRSLLAMSSELLASTITQRIATHEAEELKRKESQRLAEEKRLADEAETKRIADDAIEKAQIEADSVKAAPVVDPQVDTITQETAPERPPALQQAQAVKIDAGPTGGGVKSNQSSEPVIESFQIIVEITATVEEAREISVALDEQYWKNDCVSRVRFKRAEA